jgi:1-acyl-sn-glycerol-3-phosphate acyltransferase
VERCVSLAGCWDGSEVAGAWPLALEGSDPAAITYVVAVAAEWWRGGDLSGGCAEYGYGALDRFKAGAVRLAMEAQVPILPVTIKGGNRVWPRAGVSAAGKVVVTITRSTPGAMFERRDACVRAPRERELAQVIASAL